MWIMKATMNTSTYEICHTKKSIDSDQTVVISAFMFGAGVLGNVVALVILEVRRRRYSRAEEKRWSGLFHIFITSLVVTDLAGTCLISPIVEMSYAWNTTLIEMANGTGVVCQYFGVGMTFFSLATMSLLLATTLDRCFAIGFPYLYSRHVTKKWAYITIPVMFLINTLFCLLPFGGFGQYVQYCPGTWCFIDMNPEDEGDRAYSILYATVMLVLVMTIVPCNAFVVYHLYKMYKRRNRRGSVVMRSRSTSVRRTMSMVAEVEHLILLVIMTIIFLVCTMPLVVRVYINSINIDQESHQKDLYALRFISINSIIDPWVFIILSPGVLHFFRVYFCKARLERFRGSTCKTSLTEDTRVELSRPALLNKSFHPENKV